MFTDNQIVATSEDGDTFIRTWDEVEAFQGFRNGVFIGFSDRVMNWVPTRTFESKKHKEKFVNSVVVKLKNMERSLSSDETGRS